MRSGWTCPGYSQTAANGAEDQAQASLLNLEVVRAAKSKDYITQYSIPFKVPGSQEERRALHYFANFAAADLGGYLPSNFWSRTILQRCQHDVPVRHAAAALGRAHMEYITSPNTTGFAVSEETAAAYRKAIKALRNYLGRNSEPDRSLVLMCSAVFFCFELIRAERRGALQHLSSAVLILREWGVEHARISNPQADDHDELLDAFVRMDLQATLYDDGKSV